MPCLLLALLVLLPATALGQVAAEAAAPAAAIADTDEAPLRFDGLRLEGVDGALRDNLRDRVSLARLKTGTGLRPSRFRYFLRILPREVDAALQPFGYYDSQVTIEPFADAQALSARVRVTPGQPVRMRVKRLQIDGEGGQDARLRRALAEFRPAEGEILDHARYEASKSLLSGLLAERGYFEAKLENAGVEVHRARGEAALNLHWRSGPRYRFGDTRFSGSLFRNGLLDPLLPYRAEQPYQQEQLLVLQQRLSDLDYFSRVDVQPRPRAEASTDDETKDRPAVGIDVELGPAPRNVYRAGLSFGTDTGPGLQLGYTRRWLNERGHRFESDLLIGGERSSALLRYRIPAFEQLTGWWTARLAGREEPYPAGRAKVLEASLLRDGQWRGNTFSAGWVVAEERLNREGARLVYPQISIERRVLDDPLYPSHGYRLSLLGRWGLPGLGSEVGFRQLSVSAQLVRSFGERSRLLLRGEAGSVDSGAFERLPPSLRFFAGGDRSVRGYGYQELSPVFEGDQRVGGRHLLVGSVELERMFTPNWGGAIFVDAGNAYGSNFDPAVGVGLGLRWRSPVGPLQLDLARGLDQPDKALRLHIQLGPPL